MEDARVQNELPTLPYEIRRADSRGRLELDWLLARFSFSFGDYQDPQRMSFGALRVLNEDWIQPATGFDMHPHRDMEILLVPVAGRVAHADSLGNTATIGPDQVLMMRAGSGILHSQHNASDEAIDHHLQLWLEPRTPGLAPGIEIGSFERSRRQGRWQLLASADGRDGSLSVDQDVLIWRALIGRGGRLAFDVGAGATGSAYLQVIGGPLRIEQGEAGFQAERLDSGDAMLWTRARPFTLVADGAATDAEVLLIEQASAPA
jgi:quercetin 2,3-dioxygenase